MVNPEPMSDSLFAVAHTMIAGLRGNPGPVTNYSVTITYDAPNKTAARTLALMAAFANDWGDSGADFGDELDINTFLRRHKFSDKGGKCSVTLNLERYQGQPWHVMVDSMLQHLDTLKNKIFYGRIGADNQPIVVTHESELADTIDVGWRMIADKEKGKSGIGLAMYATYLAGDLEAYHSGYEGPDPALYASPKFKPTRRERAWEKPEEPPDAAKKEQRQEEQEKRREKRQRQQENRRRKLAEEEAARKPVSPVPRPAPEYKPQPFELPQAKLLNNLTGFQDEARRWNGMVMQDALAALISGDTLDTRIDWQKQLAEMLIGQSNLKRIMSYLDLHKTFFGSEPSGQYTSGESARNEARANRQWLAENPQAAAWLQDHAAAIPGLNLLLVSAVQPHYIANVARKIKKTFGNADLELMREFGEDSRQIMRGQINALSRGR